MEPIVNFYNFLQLDEEGINLVGKHIRCKEYLPKQKIIKQGSYNRDILFLSQGSVMTVNDFHGKSVINWIYLENNIVSPFHSLHYPIPLLESVIAIEKSAIVLLDSALFGELLLQHKVLKSVSDYYVKRLSDLEISTGSFAYKTAREKYEDLLQWSPQYLQRIPLGHIASWLGLSQSTLSRVRKKTI